MNRKKPEKKPVSQGWLTTYSDMITLVLTVFVLLYSYSLVDIKKFNAMAKSMSNAFGAAPSVLKYEQGGGNAAVVGNNKPKQEDSNSEESIYGTAQDFVKKNNLSQYVTVKEGSRGVYIEFKDKILFDTGKADIREAGVLALQKTSELIGKLPNQIVVEGHTDNVPISNSQFNSNWDLSSARAVSVLKYLTENCRLNPKRFSISAYGEYSPIASNGSTDGRAKNRRVNILIITANESTATVRK